MGVLILLVWGLVDSASARRAQKRFVELEAAAAGKLTSAGAPVTAEAVTLELIETVNEKDIPALLVWLESRAKRAVNSRPVGPETPVSQGTPPVSTRAVVDGLRSLAEPGVV